MQDRMYGTGSEDKLGEVRSGGGAIIVILSARVERSGLGWNRWDPEPEGFLES